MKVFSPKDIIQSGLCIGCGICVAISRRTDVNMQLDAYGQYKPKGPQKWHQIVSDEFSKICPFSPSAQNEDDLSETLFPDAQFTSSQIGKYEVAWAGYVAEGTFRTRGSSGGFVSWTANELLKRGLIDSLVHVAPVQSPQKESKFFKYSISCNLEEIQKGAKSRYYPVELSEVLSIIREKPGKYAIVAIPCMIKAIQLLRNNEPLLRERIKYTLGLVCGHMKSARFSESIAWQMKIPLKKVEAIEFRNKTQHRPANWYNAEILSEGINYNKDWWHMVDGDWGAGFFMNEACNYCDDVVAETADISFGDAWIEPYLTDENGNNIVIARTKFFKNLIEEGIQKNNLKLDSISAETVVKTQAAGFRQRREGLAYRLSRRKKGVHPIKRVIPDKTPQSRKLIYWIRFKISKYSHRIFWFARVTHLPFIYLIWARLVNSIYFGLSYYGGNIKRMLYRYREMN